MIQRHFHGALDIIHTAFTGAADGVVPATIARRPRDYPVCRSHSRGAHEQETAEEALLWVSNQGEVRPFFPVTQFLHRVEGMQSIFVVAESRKNSIFLSKFHIGRDFSDQYLLWSLVIVLLLFLNSSLNNQQIIAVTTVDMFFGIGQYEMR